jgi:hypothetical protein
MEISPLEAEVFHADRRTEMKLIFFCRNFANAPKNYLFKEASFKKVNF